MTLKKINFTLLGNVGSVLLQQLTIYGISLITFGVIARVLQPELMGLYALVVSSVSIVSAVANLGIKRFSVRAISGLEALSNIKGRISVFWSSILLSTLFIAGISGLTTYIFKYFNLFSISNPNLDIYLFFTLLFLYSMKLTISGGLEGLKLFHRVTVYVSSGFLLYRIMMIYAAVAGYGVTGIMLAWCIGEVFSIVMILRDLIPRYKPISLDTNVSGIIKESLPLTASDAVLASLDWADRIVISVYGYTSLAIFYVATTGVTFLSAIAQAIYSGMLPHLSEAFHTFSRDGFSNEIKQISRYILLFTSPIYMTAVALAQPTILILVGPDYLPATIVFQIIVLSLWITSLNPLLHTALIAAGKNLELMYIMVISLLIDIIFLLTFYPILGLIAAGIARGLLLATSFSLSILISQRIIDVDIDMDALIKSYLAAGIMTAVLVLLWTFIRSLSLYPLYLGAGFVVYFGTLRLLKTIKVEEIITLHNSIPDKFKWITKLICYIYGIEYNRIIEVIESEVTE